MSSTRRARRFVVPVTSRHDPSPHAETGFSSDSTSTGSDETLLALNVNDLDEPWDCQFKCKDRVWVRTKEHNWCFGVVMATSKEKPLTRNIHSRGIYYMVKFGVNSNIKKYFAPLNGEMKPDTPKVRQLLQDEGYVDLHRNDS